MYHMPMCNGFLKHFFELSVQEIRSSMPTDPLHSVGMLKTRAEEDCTVHWKLERQIQHTSAGEGWIRTTKTTQLPGNACPK